MEDISDYSCHSTNSIANKNNYTRSVDTDFTDSDDELLGITDDPIHFKTISKRTNSKESHRSWSNPSSRKTNNLASDATEHIQNGNSDQIGEPLSDGSDSDTPMPKFEEFRLDTRAILSQCYKKTGAKSRRLNPEELGLISPGMEISKLPVQQCHTLSRKKKELGANIGGRISLGLPQMKKSFGGLCQQRDKFNKYQRMREVKNVQGFIVNVHDATNFDIDLDIIPELHERYRDVISNQYTYQDLGEDFVQNPHLSQLRVTPEIGTTYRCRLKGIGINQLSSSEHAWKSSQMCVDVRQLIDITDGWVTCTLSDVDVYQRLLVDIVIHTCNGDVNLRDYLLLKMEGVENPIFYPYSSPRNKQTFAPPRSQNNSSLFF